MPVIAMTREMGSLGKEVAEGVAKELGLRPLYEEVVNDLVDRSNLSGATVNGVIESHVSRYRQWRSQPTRLNAYARASLLEIALKGDVLIRGWGAPFLFRPISHIPCIRICAPFERRVLNLMRVFPTMKRQEIEQQMKRSDRAYGASLRMSRRANTEQPWHFDLILNTEREPIECCVGAIVRITQRPEFQESEESRAELQRMAQHARIRAALKSSSITADARITVEIEKDVINLNGIVDDLAQRKAIEDIVRDLAGSRSIQSGLRPMVGGVPFHRTGANF